MVMCITRVQVAAHGQCGVHDEADITVTVDMVHAKTDPVELVIVLFSLFLISVIHVSCSDRNKSGYIAIS